MKQLANYPSLKGKRVFVTGGGSGIGESIVAAFAAQAHRSRLSTSCVNRASRCANALRRRATRRRCSAIATSPSSLPCRNDPEKKIGLFVDEWGTWYDVEKGTTPGFLFQQNTLRDAVVAALNFNIFHAHAERVQMTNIAQMVNVLQAMILTERDKMILTPTYHAFDMYVPFQDAATLPVAISDNTSYANGATTIPGISASAARAKDGKVYLSLVNTNPRDAAEVSVSVAGGPLASATGRVLTAGAMDAHNTFASPQAVKPAPFSARAAGGKLTVNVPAKSVIVVALEG